LPRTVENRESFLVSRLAVPLVTERRPRLLGLGQRDELLERKAQQVPEPDELAEPRDVRLGVVAMRPLGTRFGAAEQSQLLVVANRPRRDADLLGHFADAERARLGRAHAASSTGSRPVGTAAGVVASRSRWWYLPPRRSDATAAIRQATIA